MASTKFYLDERFPKGDGTCPLRIAISHKSNTRHLNIGVRLLPKEWDKTTCKVVSRADKNFLNTYILKKKQAVDIEVLKLLDSGKLFHLSASELRDTIARELELVSKVKEKCLFFPYAKEKNALRKKSSSLNLASNALNKMTVFIGKEKVKTFCFDDITPQWLNSFDRYMDEQGASQNTKASYFSNIRYFINLAISEDLTTNNAFKKFQVKYQATAKRSLSLEELRQIKDMKLKGKQEEVRDVFMLIFYLIGINIADLMELKELKAGRVEYYRAKTGKLYFIKVEPEAMAIINKYRDGSGLIGKILNGRSKLAFTTWLNKYLNKLHSGLTSYYARHTWASLASELDIPDDIISRALGHSGLTGARVTEVYINFNNKKIDDANRKVMNYVLYGRKLQLK